LSFGSAAAGVREAQAMKRFLTPLIIAFITALVTPFATEAKILIGMPGPMTGGMAWFGEQMEQGTAMKIAELNAAGVLGQPVELLVVDDYCDPEQAVAAARKLVEARVAAVIGHACSGAAIAASKIYEEARLLLITGVAASKLTEQGFRNVFRYLGRDTQQGTMAADYLAERWADQQIAIVHDGGAFGKGVAEAAKRRLGELGVHEVMFEAIEPGKTDYLDLIDRLQAKEVDALYFGGYSAEAGLIVRQARSRGYTLQMVGPDILSDEYFGRVAGRASEGVLFPSWPDLRSMPKAAPLVAKFRARNYEPEGITIPTYISVQIWADAVEKAGTLELDGVINSLRTNQFDTLFGTIGFDEKGDVYGYETLVWYVWQVGNYVACKASHAPPCP
jgi:branched-chain amino acid transport system substrate-binding protein